MDTLLIALENNARLSNRQLAAMLGKTEEEVEAAIEAYERDEKPRPPQTTAASTPGPRPHWHV